MPLLFVEDDAFHTAIHDSVHVVPTSITHPDRSFVGIVIVDENSLLAIPIGELAVILVRLIPIDSGRLSADVGVVIGYSEQRPTQRRSVLHDVLRMRLTALLLPRHFPELTGKLDRQVHGACEPGNSVGALFELAASQGCVEDPVKFRVQSPPKPGLRNRFVATCRLISGIVLHRGM